MTTTTDSPSGVIPDPQSPGSANRKRRFWRATVVAGAAIVALWYFTLVPQFLVMAAVNLWHYGFTEEGYKRVGSLAHNLRLSFEPLPSDEEMIQHFQQHRGEIEKLVQLYRDYEPQRGQKDLYWADAPEIKALRERAAVERVNGSTSGGLWIAEPYSREAAKLAESQVRSADMETVERRYGTILIEFSPLDRYFSPSRRYGTLIKEVLYLPQAPKITQGEAWWPVDAVSGEPTQKRSVVQTLDRYPPNLNKGDCVVRPIEAQWFLSLCRAY